VFTIKNLERSVDIKIGDARTQSIYGKSKAQDHEGALVAGF
jgi:hypothetical protein